MLSLSHACRRQLGYRQVIVTKPLERLGAGWNALREHRGPGLRGLHRSVGRERL